MTSTSAFRFGLKTFQFYRQVHFPLGAQWPLSQAIQNPFSCSNNNNKSFHTSTVRQRYLSRKPIKVFNENPEDEFTRTPEAKPARRVLEENARKRGKQNMEIPDQDEGEFFKRGPDGFVVLPTKNGEIKYKKLTAKDKTFMREMTDAKKESRRGNSIILEGRRLLNDAVMAGLKVRKVFFCHIDMLNDLGIPSSADVEYFKVYDRAMDVWSDLKTPPGIIAVCEKPSMTTILEQQVDSLPLVVLCDNVRDPGNMGAIMRSVAAAGCKMLITTTGCVNVWDGKVLRAASGAHFHLPVYNNIDWPNVRNYLPEEFKVVLADNVGGSNMNSAFQTKPEKMPRKEPKAEDVEENLEVEVDEDGLINDTTYSDPEVLEKFADIKLPVEHFPKIRFSLDLPTVLVIGGETMGLSLASRKLAYDNDGKIVTLPLRNNIESLNSGVACGILAYEMRRQFSS